MAGGPPAGGARLPETGCQGKGLYRVRPFGDRLGPCRGGQLSVPLLPLGGRCIQGQGVRPGADGALPGGRPGPGKIRHLHAGGGKQKAWLSDQSFARKYGFETVDETGYGYTLLARSFDGTLPRFTDQARAGTIGEKALTVYYSDQCPYVANSLEIIRQVCGEAGAPYSLVPVDTLEKAKALPCVFNNYAVFYGGAFQTVNLLDAASLRRLLKR